MSDAAVMLRGLAASAPALAAAATAGAQALDDLPAAQAKVAELGQTVAEQAARIVSMQATIDQQAARITELEQPPPEPPPDEPEPTVEPIPASGTYTVQPGDWLSTIAARFGLDWHDLAAWNHITDPSLITPGQVLVLTAPDGTTPEPETEPPPDNGDDAPVDPPTPVEVTPMPEPAIIFEPVAAYLPSGYTPGSSDIGPAVQKAAAAIERQGRGFLLMPPGTHKWNTPVYLAGATRELTYGIVGHGRGTVLQLGSGLGTGWAVYVNQDADGRVGVANPRHPRLVGRDLEITGGQFAYGTQGASMDFERVRCNRVKNLATVRGYTDLMRFRHIMWEVASGPMYYNHGSGDGLVIEQVSAFGDDLIADLDGCHGGVIRSVIGGRFELSDCDGLLFEGTHLDSKGNGGSGYISQPWCKITNSRVSFGPGWDHIGPTAPLVEITDSGDSYSDVAFDGYTFGFRPHTADKLRAPHVRLASVTAGTKVRFRRCDGRLLPQNSQNRYSIGPIVAAKDPAVQAAIDARPTLALEDADLLLSAGGWQVVHSSGGRHLPKIGDPSLSVGSSGVVPGTGGSFVYRVAVITDKQRDQHTGASPERSVSVASGRSAQLTVDAHVQPALVRVWRGTSTGRYDRYVDVPCGATADLFDTGPAVCGYPWITTGVPAVPSSNTTADQWVSP